MDSRQGQRDSVQLINSVCKRRAPRFLAERISNIKASSSALILVFGDFKGHLLWLLNPSIPCSEYRFHHLRNVGLEMPHLRQTRPALLVSSNHLTHTSLCWISLFIDTHYIEVMSMNHTDYHKAFETVAPHVWIHPLTECELVLDHVWPHFKE